MHLLHEVPAPSATASQIRLQHALALLPDEMRTVLRLRRSRGLSNQETAARMERSEAAARALYGRAMARLARSLAATANSSLPGLTLVLRAC